MQKNIKVYVSIDAYILMVLQLAFTTGFIYSR